MPDKDPPYYVTTRAFQDSSAPPPRFPTGITSFSDHAVLPVWTANPTLVSRFCEFAPCFNPILGELDLRKELDRLKSFGDDWPSCYDIRAAAKGGFFYLGSDDRIQCFSCGYVLQNWDFPHDPMLLHMGLQPPCAMAIGYETKNVPAISQGSSILSVLHLYPLTENYPAAGSVARTDDYDEAHAHPFGTGSPTANTTTSVLRFLQDRMQALRNRDFIRTFQHSVAETGHFTFGTSVQQQSPDNARNINSFISDTSQLSLNVPRHDELSTSAKRDEPELELEQQQEIQRRNLSNGKLPESLPDGDAGYDTFQGTLDVSSVLFSEGADSSSVDGPSHLLQTSDLTDTALESTSASIDETAASTIEDSAPILPEEEE